MPKLIFVVLSTLLLAACGNDKSLEETNGLTKIVLQTDWYAQPEHGGFYQALAKGYYEAEGLDVHIQLGANLNTIPQMVATRRVDFAIGATETLLIHRSRNIPLVSLFPYFQHDPQCALFHPESGIKTIEDLNGREVMFEPNSVYIEYLQTAKGYQFQLLPMTWSLTQFASDPEFVQQCFLTSEPIHLRHQGIIADVIRLSDSGFDPYRHVYTSQHHVDNNPEMVAAFVRASLKGWQDFVSNDPTPAFELIMAANPQQTLEMMTEILAAMKSYKLTHGDKNKGETLGQYNKVRLRKVIAQMLEIGLLENSISLDESFAFRLLPAGLVTDDES